METPFKDLRIRHMEILESEAKTSLIPGLFDLGIFFIMEPIVPDGLYRVYVKEEDYNRLLELYKSIQ